MNTKIFFLFLFLLPLEPLSAQWIKVNSNTENEIYNLNFVSTQIGYFVNKEGLFKTTDSGFNWEKHEFVNEEFNDIFCQDVQFIHPDTGFVVGHVKLIGHPIIIKTVNGGKTWFEVLRLNMNSTFYAISVDSRPGTSYGTVVGHDGILAYTQDRGKTWQQGETEPSGIKLNDVTSTQYNTSLIGGDGFVYDHSYGNYSKTHDVEKVTYNAVKTILLGWLNTYMIGGSDGQLLQYNRQYKVFENLKVPESAYCSDFHFFDKDEGFLVGTEIYYTKNRGQFWRKLKMRNGERIEFVNDTLGFLVVGHFGDLYRIESGIGESVGIASGHVPEKFCINETVNFENLGDPVYEYEWIVNGKTYSNSYDTVYVPQPKDEFKSINIQLILHDTNGYSKDTFSINRTVISGSLENPVDILYDDTLCYEENLEVNVLNSVKGVDYTLLNSQLNRVTSKYSYQDSLTLKLSSKVYPKPFETNQSSETWYIEVHQDNICSGYKDTISIPFTYYNPRNRGETMTRVFSKSCVGDSVLFWINNSDPTTVYSCDGLQTAGTGDSLVIKTKPLFKQIETYDLMMQPIDYQCPQYKSSSAITYTHNGKIKLNHSDFIILTTINDTVSYPLTSEFPYHKWTFDTTCNIVSSSMKEPKFFYNTAGIKNILIEATDSAQCQDSFRFNLPIIDTSQIIPSEIGTRCFWDNVKEKEGEFTPLTSEIVTTFHVDERGNYYTGGNYFSYRNYNFSKSMTGAYFRKYDPNGVIQWERKESYDATSGSFSSKIKESETTVIKTDSSLNIYIAGNTINDNLIFGTYREITGLENFLVKYDSLGIFKWGIITEDENNNNKAITDILFIDNDNIYVSMIRPKKVIFKNKTVNIPNEYVIVKINSEGHYLSHRAYQLSGEYSYLSPVLEYLNGTLFVIGRCDENGAGNNSSIKPKHKGSTTFMLEYDTELEVFTKKTYYGTLNMGLKGAPVYALDSNKNFYTSRNSQSNLETEDRTIYLNDTTTTTSGYIAKYDNEGNLNWFNPIFNLRVKGMELLDDQLIVIANNFTHNNSNSQLGKYGLSTPNYGCIGGSFGYYPERFFSHEGIVILGFDTANGNLLWKDTYDSREQDFAWKSVKNGCGEVYFAFGNKRTYDDGFSYKFNSDSTKVKAYGLTLQHFSLNNCGGPCLTPKSYASNNSMHPNKKIKLFPNPTKSILNLEWEYNNKPLDMKLFDLQGKEILIKNIDNNKIDFSNLSKGIYLLNLIYESEVVIKTIVKK